jgi:hypothetical protein
MFGLAILTYLFNNNTQNGKADFICQLLNNKACNAIYVGCRDANFASIICSLFHYF